MDAGGPRRPDRARRLFVAIEVPPAVHRAVEAAVAPWRATPSARWIPVQNRHVTLRFLGPVPADSVDRARDAVASVAAGMGPVPTRLTHLGAFPSPARARVLWVGIDDRAGHLARLALAVDAALAPEFAPRTRPLRPHLSVARCDPPVRLPSGSEDAPVEPAPFEVRRLVLFETVAGSGPSRYEALEVAELGD